METLETIHIELEQWDDKYAISDGEDIEHTLDTLASAYLQLAQTLAQKSDCYFKMAMDELQNRINKL